MTPLISQPIGKAEDLETGIFQCQHDLSATGLFSDEKLLNIFESHPSDYMQIYTMGDDHSDLDDFRLGDRGGLSSEQLLKAVKEGKLWFNLMYVDHFHPEYKIILDQLFDELEQANPDFKTFDRRATLLVSSPKAKVFYHADGPPNILWHIRGKKKISLYPLTEEFAPQLEIEKIFSRESDDDLPYSIKFDESSSDYTLQQGEMIAWPQNMPHRVENLDSFCVSLSAEYYSLKSMRKKETYLANYYLRRWLKLPCYSIETQGVLAMIKRNVYRLLSRLPFPKVEESDDVYQFSLNDIVNKPNN